jgi:hypothetical protein
MGRLILLALAVLVLVWLVRRALRARGRPPPPAADLVSCARCGVLLPRAEARAAPGAEARSVPGDSGAQYCSEEHARLGPRRP